MDDLRWTGLSTFAEEKPPVEEEEKKRVERLQVKQVSEETAGWTQRPWKEGKCLFFRPCREGDKESGEGVIFWVKGCEIEDVRI